MNVNNDDEKPQYCTPGLVKWHADYPSAVRSSIESNKLVLLFEMLGRLDEEFC